MIDFIFKSLKDKGIDLINPYQNKEISSHIYTPSKQKFNEKSVTGEDDDDAESELYYYSQEEKVNHNDSSQFTHAKSNVTEPDAVNRNKYQPCGESEGDSWHCEDFEKPSIHRIVLRDEDSNLLEPYQIDDPISHMTNHEVDESN